MGGQCWRKEKSKQKKIRAMADPNIYDTTGERERVREFGYANESIEVAYAE